MPNVEGSSNFAIDICSQQSSISKVCSPNNDYSTLQNKASSKKQSSKIQFKLPEFLEFCHLIFDSTLFWKFWESSEAWRSWSTEKNILRLLSIANKIFLCNTCILIFKCNNSLLRQFVKTTEWPKNTLIVSTTITVERCSFASDLLSL